MPGNLNAKKAKFRKQVNPIIERETAILTTTKTTKLSHDERVDIFYDPNKVSKEIFLLDEVYIRILHIAELEV